MKKWTSALMLAVVTVFSLASTGCSSTPAAEEKLNSDVQASVETQKDLGATNAGRGR